MTFSSVWHDIEFLNLNSYSRLVLASAGATETLFPQRLKAQCSSNLAKSFRKKSCRQDISQPKQSQSERQRR